MTENARLEVRISKELRERIELLALAREQTVSAWVKQAILSEAIREEREARKPKDT